MFAHELGFQNVIIEGDVLGLIQALKSRAERTPIGTAGGGCESLLESFSKCVVFSYKEKWQ